MTYEELIAKQEEAAIAVKDSQFSTCINCDGEEFINLSITGGTVLELSMSRPNLITSPEQLIALRDVLIELFPSSKEKK